MVKWWRRRLIDVNGWWVVDRWWRRLVDVWWWMLWLELLALLVRSLGSISK